MKKGILLAIFVISQFIFATNYVKQNGSVTQTSIKHPITQRKWYSGSDGEPKHIFVNIGYHKYLNGFCHEGGVSARKVISYESQNYSLTKHQCSDFNGSKKDETFFLLKTKDKHYLKVAQCTQDKKLASIAYSIAYDFKNIKAAEKKVAQYCLNPENRKPLLFDTSRKLNSYISISECQKLLIFVFNALSEKNWGQYDCSR